MKYTIQQRVFIYATFIRTDSTKETRKIFQREFGAIQPPSYAVIKQIVDRFRETGSFEDDISLRDHRMLTEEKLDELCCKMGDIRKKTLADLAVETGWNSRTLKIAEKLLWTHYKIKLKKKKSRNRSSWKPVRNYKDKSAVPVSVISAEGLNRVDSSSTNEDSMEDGEFVLPDDPLADKDDDSTNFNFKTEVKEEIMLEDVIVKEEIMTKDDNVKEEIIIDDDDEEIVIDDIKEEIIIDEDDDTFPSSLQDSSSIDILEDIKYEDIRT